MNDAGLSRRTVAAQVPPKSGAVPAGERLARLGLSSDMACILHLPLRYEDETVTVPFAAVAPGQYAQVEGSVVDCQILFRPRRQLLVTLSDGAERLALRFIHFYGSQQKHFAPQARIRARGDVRDGPFGPEIVHPRYTVLTDETPLPTTLTPIYPSTEGVSQALLRAAIGRALKRAPLSDTLPATLYKAYGLMEFAQAVRILHHPPADVSLEALADRSHPAWQRIKFDELVAQQLSLKRALRARRRQSATPLRPQSDLVQRFLAGLPFELTAAQRRVWREVAADLCQPHPMQRLLQGDVGSGKTVVAALAALCAIDSGRQAALMAPTEILAEQHFRKLSEWIAALGVEVAWLTGSQKKKERGATLAAITEGRARLVVGTHALIQDAVSFEALGLIIVDEQHRFGVEQRLALRAKSEGGHPHQLMMSATPIPRTLAMSYYADLEVSTIDELPPGRKPVVTKVFSDTRRERVLERLAGGLIEGEQAYWVCPLVEESEALDLQDAVQTAAQLQARLPRIRVGLIHGRMSAAEKSAVMAEFAAGTIALLVATTVIEVGVDVPNASLMVIEHAERFGLAQLHQLRGRIGRGRRASSCILLYQRPLSETARQRLAVMRATQDGFEIARQDLALRGPGEFLGQRQSGAALLRFVDLAADEALLEPARAAAEALLRDHADLAARHLERWLGSREDFLKT